MVLGTLIVLALVTFYVAFGPAGRVGAGTGASSTSTSTGSVVVDFGAPIVATATCLNGQSTSVEAVPWLGSSAPLSTANISVELVELIDGDVDGGPIAPPSVTPNYVCGQAFESAWAAWYVVLANPSGENLAYYSYSTGWVNLAGVTVPIENGSSLTLVSDPSFAGLSFALCVIGHVGGPTIDSCDQL